MERALGFSGGVSAKVTRAPKAPVSWRIKNATRFSFIYGKFVNYLAAMFSRLTGIPTMTAKLDGRLIKADGTVIDYGTLSYRVITNAGVAFLVDDWDDSTTDITTMNYHGCGTGAVAENQTDSALGAESTTILSVDSTRATGTKTQPSANVLQSVGTLSFDGSGAITEHGLFSTSGTGSGVLWDRSVFAAINVASGDSIQFTYQCTVAANG